MPLCEKLAQGLNVRLCAAVRCVATRVCVCGRVYNFRAMGDRAKNVKSKSPIALRFEGFPLTGSSCAEPLAP